MNDTLAGFVVGLFIGAGILALFLILSGKTYPNGYKNGQVAALTGNIKYELVINSDSSKTWKKIENHDE